MLQFMMLWDNKQEGRGGQKWGATVDILISLHAAASSCVTHNSNKLEKKVIILKSWNQNICTHCWQYDCLFIYTASIFLITLFNSYNLKGIVEFSHLHSSFLCYSLVYRFFFFASLGLR